MENILKSAGIVATEFFAYFFGGWDVAIQVLIVVMALDYLTGVISAIKNKELSSKIGLIGILKKVGLMSIVCLAFMIDRLLGEEGICRNITIYFFVANEGISILENCTLMGLPIPQKLQDILLQIRDKSDKKEE